MRTINADDLISREALRKAFLERIYYFNKSSWDESNALIDNAPTVDTTCPNCDSGYAQGYSDGYLKGKEERPIDDLSEYSDKLWKQAYERGKAEERPQGEWIPVSERLPEENIRVLVWFEYRTKSNNSLNQTHGFCFIYGGVWSSFINGETGWQDARIIAWMPLPEPPEPYKEAENEIHSN